ncbi:MAG: hypothetical protein QF733_01480 [Phycisphaerales bacterium]|nr:hypothetical protein [Phycisphaerales bacterium]
MWSVALPAIGAGVLLALVWWAAGDGCTWVPRVVVPLVLAGAAAGSFIASIGLPEWPLAQKWHGLVWVFGAIAAAGMLDGALRAGDWAARLVVACVAGGAAAWLLHLPDTPPLAVGMAVGGLTYVGGMLDSSGRGVPILAGIWAGGAALSLLILVAASMTVSLIAGAVSATAALVVLVGILLRGRAVWRSGGGGAAGGGLLAALALTGWSYDYDIVPLWAWWAGVAGFPIACMLELGSLEKWHGVMSGLARTGVLVAPPVAAIVLNWDAIQGAFSG